MQKWPAMVAWADSSDLANARLGASANEPSRMLTIYVSQVNSDMVLNYI